jgi:hypothetical protein
MSIDEASFIELLGKLVGDLRTTTHAGTVVIGEELGLFRALAAAPMSVEELASKTSTDEHYVRAWLARQQTLGYIDGDPQGTGYRLSEEQASVLAAEASPAHLLCAFSVLLRVLSSDPQLRGGAETGIGQAWSGREGWLEDLSAPARAGEGTDVCPTVPAGGTTVH